MVRNTLTDNDDKYQQLYSLVTEYLEAYVQMMMEAYPDGDHEHYLYSEKEVKRLFKEITQ